MTVSRATRRGAVPLSRGRLFAFRAITFALTAVVLFAGVEVALRVLLAQVFTAATESPLMPSPIPGLGYQMAPGYVKGAYGTDDDGLPIPSRRLEGDGYRVLVVGDSVAFGSGVDYDKTLTPAMTASLSEAIGRPVAVWNGAVPGYNTVQQAVMLDALAPRVRPDLVLVAFCMNDYLDPPRLTEGGRLDATAPASNGSMPLTSYLWRSRTLVFAKEKIKDLQKTYPEWFPVWTHDIHYLTQRPGWNRAQEALLRIQESTRRNGAKLLLVIFPVEQQLRLGERDAQDNLAGFANAHGIEVLDLFPAFQAHWREGLYVDWWPEAGSVDKLHLNARGHYLAGHEIAARVAAGSAHAPRARSNASQ